jgi:transposase InsO family protein
MAQVLHGCATTTARLRADIQASAEPTAVVARRYSLNPKTVAKWRAREGVEDRPMGPRERRSSVLSSLEEAAIVAFRTRSRLPLDDVFLALKPAIPALTRSTLHRCLQRHGVSRLPRPARERPQRFKAYEIGYLHVDIAEVRVAEAKAYLFVAVDRTAKLVVARLYRRATSRVAATFLKVLVKAVPYRIHTVLTDNGIQFTDTSVAKYPRKLHAFDMACRRFGIEHRLTRPYHPWTNGQAERTIRTLKDATVRTYHYDTVHQLRRHIADFLAAYNFARQLKALRWQTPHETIQAAWRAHPERFVRNPGHDIPGPNT